MYWSQIDQTNDIIKLVEFEQKVHPKSDWVTVNEYIFWFKRGLKIYVLENNDDYVGVFQILEEPDEIFFHGFAVNPKYQGNGYGQTLIDYMIKEYSNKNITCKTRPDNYIMVNLLVKNSFVKKLDEVINDGDQWTWWTKSPEM